MILSILIPAYNVEKYIIECLDSICSQINSSEIEVIVVNDGSTDQTPSLLNNYKSPYVRILNQENLGIGPTRNRLLSEAKGRYIWFVDGDDKIEIRSIETILNYIRNKRFDILELSYSLLTSDQEKIPGRIYKGSFASGIDFVENGYYDNTVWSKIIRRGIIIKSGIHFETLITGEDFVFSFKLMATCKRVECNPISTYLYRCREDSVCSNRSDTHLQKLSEASLITARSLNVFISSLQGNAKIIMDRWFRSYLAGYLFSLIRFPQYSFPYIQKRLLDLKEMNLYPIRTEKMSIKVFLFLLLFNNILIIKWFRPFFYVNNN